MTTIYQQDQQNRYAKSIYASYKSYLDAALSPQRAMTLIANAHDRTTAFIRDTIRAWRKKNNIAVTINDDTRQYIARRRRWATNAFLQHRKHGMAAKEAYEFIAKDLHVSADTIRDDVRLHCKQRGLQRNTAGKLINKEGGDR